MGALTWIASVCKHERAQQLAQLEDLYKGRLTDNNRLTKASFLKAPEHTLPMLDLPPSIKCAQLKNLLHPLLPGGCDGDNDGSEEAQLDDFTQGPLQSLFMQLVQWEKTLQRHWPRRWSDKHIPQFLPNPQPKRSLSLPYWHLPRQRSPWFGTISPLPRIPWWGRPRKKRPIPSLDSSTSKSDGTRTIPQRRRPRNA